MDKPRAIGEIHRIIGRNVKALRLARGWSTREMVERLEAEGMKLSMQTLRDKEAGRTRFSIPQVQAFARVFQVSDEEICSRP